MKDIDTVWKESRKQKNSWKRKFFQSTSNADLLGCFDHYVHKDCDNTIIAGVFVFSKSNSIWRSQDLCQRRGSNFPSVWKNV